MIALAGFSLFSQAEAMTAERVIENMIASYERQMKGVEDFTIVSEMANQGITTYHKRAVVRGKVVYKIRTETEVMGTKNVTIYDGDYYWWVEDGKLKKEKMDSPHAILENLKAAQVRYAGTEKIDGHKTHILDVRDLNTVMGGEMQKVSGKLWVDASDWVIRKMEMDWEIEDDRGQKDVVKFISMAEDFRKVNGMLIPHRTVTTTPSMPKLSPKEEQELREKLAEIKRELEEMPPDERKMFEAMIKPKMEQIEKLLAGSRIEVAVVVKDVKVNSGLSDELFDGSKLKR
jgi:outer membrane lipoprotein-sorting protein